MTNLTTPNPAITAALVLDANAAISICAKEARTEAAANTALDDYADRGYLFYAPGVIVSETLYALRNQLTHGFLTALEHGQAIRDFAVLMQNVLPPPNGDAALILRADQICAGYGASRSADAVYLALAEELAASYADVRLLTFDADLPKQAARNAPTVTVHLLR